MTRILLVEDESSLGETLKERLEREGYQVEWVTTLSDAQASILSQSFNLIILDVGLPDGSGFELAKAVKTKTSTPFLFVSAMTSAEFRLRGFELGAEEYIPKPFHLKELLIRVRHVLQTHCKPLEYQYGPRTIDFSQMAVLDESGRRLDLPPRDMRLLQLLIESSPRVVSRDEILDQIWGDDRFPSTRTVDNAVVRIRQVLGTEISLCLRSVRGVGYQWIKGAN